MILEFQIETFNGNEFPSVKSPDILQRLITLTQYIFGDFTAIQKNSLNCKENPLLKLLTAIGWSRDGQWIRQKQFKTLFDWGGGGWWEEFGVGLDKGRERKIKIKIWSEIWSLHATRSLSCEFKGILMVIFMWLEYQRGYVC